MYKPINGWTKAKMIEKIREFVPEDKACMTSLGACVYSNSKGKRCAVGAFLPNDCDFFDFEGDVVDLLDTALADGVNLKLPIDVDGLSYLQGVHDSFGSRFAGAPRTDLGVGPQDACIAWIEQNVSDEAGEEN